MNSISTVLICLTLITISIVLSEEVLFNKKIPEINQVFKGCYAEEYPVTKPDLAGYLMLVKKPDPEYCCLVCRKKGWPFCGLFKAFQCHCGSSYGSGGPSLGELTCLSRFQNFHDVLKI